MTEIILLFNIIIAEILLSVDNAAVLAVMVKGLPKEQQSKALRYGLLGAYIFRGLSLVFAAWLVQFIWLKLAGGIYLIYLAWSSLKEMNQDGDIAPEEKGWMTKIKKVVGPFWGTVILVEIIDIVFSLDNLLAVVAMTNKIWIIIGGVMVGILAMRFVAGKFVALMEKYPSLNGSALLVIALLGVKLILGGLCDYVPSFESLKLALESHTTDLIFSLCMMVIFFTPIVIGKITKK